VLNALKNKITQLAEKAEEAAFAAEIEWEKIKLSEDERNSRYDICKKCEWLFTPTNNCKKCGCFMAVKTYMPSQSCPIGKWKSIPIVDKSQEESI
jgi:hypothetical protein